MLLSTAAILKQYLNVHQWMCQTQGLLMGNPLMNVFCSLNHIMSGGGVCLAIFHVPRRVCLALGAPVQPPLWKGTKTSTPGPPLSHSLYTTLPFSISSSPAPSLALPYRPPARPACQ